MSDSGCGRDPSFPEGEHIDSRLTAWTLARERIGIGVAADQSSLLASNDK